MPSSVEPLRNQGHPRTKFQSELQSIWSAEQPVLDPKADNGHHRLSFGTRLRNTAREPRRNARHKPQKDLVKQQRGLTGEVKLVLALLLLLAESRADHWQARSSFHVCVPARRTHIQATCKLSVSSSIRLEQSAQEL